MPNKQIEREEVLKPCLKLCKKLKAQGYILKYRRLDALDYYHEAGDPDIEIWFSRNGLLHILLAECKIPTGGIISKHQKECCEKYSSFFNVCYKIIKNVSELEFMITHLAVNIYFKPELMKEMQEWNP